MAIQKSCGFCPPEVRDSGGAEENNSGSSIGGIKEEEKKKEEKEEDKEPVDTTLTKATDDTETTYTEHVTENYGGYGKTEDYVPNENEYGWSGGSGGDSEENPMKKDEIDRLPILPVRMMPVTNVPTKPKTRDTPPPVQKKATPNVVNTQKVTETKVAELPPALTKKVYIEPAVAHQVATIDKLDRKKNIVSRAPIEQGGPQLQDANVKWPENTSELFSMYFKQRNDLGSELKRTCEDYFIEAFVDFTDQNGLSLVFDNVDRNILAASVDETKRILMKKNAAEDLRQNKIFTFHGNTRNTSQRLGIKEGDVLFSMTTPKNSYDKPRHAHHVMIVKEVGTVTQQKLNEWKNKPTYSGNFKIGDRYAIIQQGNTRTVDIVDEYTDFGKSDPADDDYIGLPIQSATYNLTTDVFVRDFVKKVSKQFSEIEDQNIGRVSGYKPNGGMTGKTIIAFINKIAYFFRLKPTYFANK